MFVSHETVIGPCLIVGQDQHDVGTFISAGGITGNQQQTQERNNKTHGSRKQRSPSLCQFEPDRNDGALCLLMTIL